MANFSFEQSFAGSIPIPDNNPTGITSSLLIDQVIPTGAVISSIEIFNLDITHTFNSDLDISVINPNGKSIDLSSDNGGNGDNYVDVNFSDSASTLIGSLSGVITQPITGTFTPEQPLAGLLGGTTAGLWSLKVVDDAPGDTGSLTSWGIRFNVIYSGTVTGTLSADTLNGSSQVDHIFGRAGNDTITAFGGDDLIYGGRGKDVMSGGGGADQFMFENRFESGALATTRDLITDWDAADRINVRDIDANELKFGNQNFQFIGKQEFHGVAGELRYVKIDPAGTANDVTVVLADVNGDAIRDFAVGIAGLHNLNSGDFIL